MVFNQRGSYITQYSNAIEGLALEIPHSLALSSDGQKLYVADRENYRIVEYNTETGRGRVFVSPEKMGGAIFAISFSDKAGHWPMYAVNGSLDESMRCVGFTINKDGNVIGTWFPPPGNKVSGRDPMWASFLLCFLKLIGLLSRGLLSLMTLQLM